MDRSDGVTASTPGNEDLLKVLRKLGYPEVEEGAKPSCLLHKVILCITKKLKKLSDLLPAESSAPTAGEDRHDAEKGGDEKDGSDASKNVLAQKSDSQDQLYVAPTRDDVESIQTYTKRY